MSKCAPMDGYARVFLKGVEGIPLIWNIGQILIWKFVRNISIMIYGENETILGLYKVNCKRHWNRGLTWM